MTAVTDICLYSRPALGMGDVIQRNIVLNLLRGAFPQPRVTWILGHRLTWEPVVEDLVRRHSYADEVMLGAEPDDDEPARRRFLDELAARRFDACIVEPFTVGFGAGDAAEAGIEVRVAVPEGGPDDAFITHPVLPGASQPSGPDMYDYLAALGAALDAPVPPPPAIVPRLPYQPEDLPAWADRRPFVGLHPGGMKLWNRRWPLASYTELAARLVDTMDAAVLVLGSPDEQEEAELLRDGVLARQPRAEVHSCLGEPVNRVANLVDRMDLLVGNDSGLAHLAAALSTPTVVVYGPADGDVLFGRMYPLQRAVNNHPDCQGSRDGVDPAAGQCQHGCLCYYVSADGPYPTCLTEITVDEVWRVVEEQLSAGPLTR
jgi:ADP-heptose:LPS heptosyltransferase